VGGWVGGWVVTCCFVGGEGWKGGGAWLGSIWWTSRLRLLTQSFCCSHSQGKAAATKRGKTKAQAPKKAAKGKGRAAAAAAPAGPAAAAYGSAPAAAADSEEPAPKPPAADGPTGTLLVVPLSVMSNWITQLEVRLWGHLLEVSDAAHALAGLGGSVFGLGSGGELYM